MILRPLSPATPGCINDLHSVFEALREGECALGPLKSLVDHQSGVQMLSSVGGIAGKLALNVGGKGVLVARRSVAPVVSSGLRALPVVGSKVNELVMSGKWDLPGGMIEPGIDRTPMTGLFREVDEEGLRLPMLDKALLLGCYAKATTSGVEAVVRMGVAAAIPCISEFRTSAEHTVSSIAYPVSPQFPEQWRGLGDEAMRLAA